SLGPVRAGHQLDLKALQDYLQAQLPELFRGAPTSQGRIDRLVLRKKPPGKLLASAHAVEREYAVMAALSPTGFPVPRAVHLCQTEKPLGTPFYLMECVEGRIFLDPNLPELPPHQRTEIYRHMAQVEGWVQVLASLHSKDPGALGLASFGNPDRYCSRQLRRWGDQYTASVPSPTPGVTRLVDWLTRHVPETDASSSSAQNTTRPAIVHGEFRLDNIVFGSATTPKAASGSLSSSSSGGFLGCSPRAAALRERLEEFMRDHVYPAEEVLEAHAMGPQATRWTIHPLLEELKKKAKRAPP
ncbi:hypothetical protein VOLCADRAFT_118146, partial [Volvox carteri f. nagariensis]